MPGNLWPADSFSRVDTCSTTSGSATVGDPAILSTDNGRPVSGPGIPANTFVGTVTAGASFLLSSSPTSQVNVTATATAASVTLTVGQGGTQYTGRALRQTLGVLAYGATATRPLGAVSGVRWGTGTPISVTTASVSVGPHAGQIDAETANQAGPYWYSFDSAQNRAINAAQSNPRIDIVYVQVSDPAESDGTSLPGVDIFYKAGTAAGTPTQPTTPARSMLIGVIQVPATGQGNPTVQWVAPYLPHNDFYSASLINNTTVTTAGPINLTSGLSIPAVPYPTILDISFGALISAQNASTDVVEISLFVGSSSVRSMRQNGSVFSIAGDVKVQVPANTATSLQMQAAKVSGSGTSSLPFDGARRWLECMVIPN